MISFWEKFTWIPVIEKRKKPASALQVVKFVKNDDKGTKVPMRDGSMHNLYTC
jgi:hypothetical protein